MQLRADVICPPSNCQLIKHMEPRVMKPRITQITRIRRGCDSFALGKFCIWLLAGNVVFLQKILLVGVLMLATVVWAEPEFNEIMEKAKAGDVNAMCELARCYNLGIGVSHSTERTSEWTQMVCLGCSVVSQGDCCWKRECDAISRRLLLVPFLLPSTRRWARVCRDKKSALALERTATYEERKSV